MLGIRCSNSVITEPGIRRREYVLGVSSTSAGKVDEEKLVENTTPPLGLPFARYTTKVVNGSLARHATAAVRSATHLIDVDVVSVELEIFLSSFLDIVAFDRLLTKLHREVEGDLFTSIRL